MFEDERQRASWRRHGAIARGVAKRGLVAFLAFAMAFGTTPAQLWAEGAEGIAEAVAQAATGGEGAAADDGTAADTGANSAAASAAADGASADQGATASTANGADTAVGNATESESSPAAPATSEQENAVAAASATTLSSEAKVFIQDARDKDNSYLTKSGALSAGDTLWANMYDEVEDDWYGTSTESVANPGTWTYTWLAGTTRHSSNVADYTEVVGHEQSLTITDAMEGKYFICKVTVDGKDYYGPAAYGSGINSKDIPGPVLGAGQMELDSVKLSSDTPSIGDTLTATPYISYYQQAPADAKVTYTWSASTSQYSGFTKIEGATGATLVVGDDLEGKYIRVEANAGVNTVNKITSSKVKQAGAVDFSAVSIVNTKDNTSVFAVGDTAKARAKEKGGAYGAFVDASKLNYQWQSSNTKSGTYTDIAGATGETLELTDALGGKYLKCKVSSKIGSSSMTNSTGALVAAAGSIHVTSVTMSPTSGKVEVGSTISATAKAGSTDVTTDSHVTWQWYKGTSNYASSCNTPIEGETGNTLTVTAALKGCYVVAKANGGYGEQKPYYAAGPVSVAGQVELYDVQFEGSPATNGVHVGDTLKTKVRKKDGSNYHYIDRTDNVTYQWQYANSSSSYDSAYTDIPGATEATYTVDAAYAGKYLRVKVTSENTVSSTQKKSSYGGTQSVAPLGPVTRKGQYKLAGIELADKNVTLSVGSKITPSVQVPGSWSGSTKDVPDDAELTMARYAKGEGDAGWTELTDGIDTTDGSLTISDALVGKRIKVTASALDNTVEWVSSDSVTAAGKYNLLRVTTTPQINSDSTHLVSGDSVKATAQAKRADGSTTNGIDVTDRATVAWYAADDAKAPAADWTLLPDMSGATATVSASAAGKYLKAVATSGSSTVELVSVNPVIAAGSLEAAVQKLNDANKQIAVDYSAKGGNVNDVLKAQLADLGFTDIDVKVSEGGVDFKAGDAKATVGISDAQDKTNGDVTFFFIDPNDYTGYNIDGLRSADVVFELSRDGKTEYYQPNKSVQVAWDEARVQQMLDDAAEQVAIGYAAGDSAESVTSNLTLPYRAGSKNKFEVSWKSSDGDVIWPSGYGWDDYTGKVTRVSSDRTVTLTATVSFVSGGPSDVEGSHDFAVTVKGDPEKVAADKKALQEKVDAAFTYDNIKYFDTKTVANKDGLTADLQIPRTSTLNIDGKYYKVEYSASTDDITFNGYKGTVYQPLPGTEAAKTKVTLTVTDKSNAEVTASKTLDFAIAPQDQGELNAELSLMEKAKAGYAAAILNGQDANAVSTDMHAFQKAYLDADGNLAWSYNKATTDSTSLGIVPVDLPGYDAMSGQDWRLFKSSNSSIVSAENLKVTQPEYNTKVVISSRLTSEKYARYAERYPGNATYAKLANQDVSAKITVLGTSGQNSPEVTATCSVIGIDAKGKQQTWAAATQYTLKNGSTAADLSEQVFKQAGIGADVQTGSYGWFLNSLTSPFNKSVKLSTVQVNESTWKSWQFFVNGKMANVGAGNYTLKTGDEITWVYGSDGTMPGQVAVSMEIIGKKGDKAQRWTDPSTQVFVEGTTIKDATAAYFDALGIESVMLNDGGYWNVHSLVSPLDGTKLTGSWSFFVNGVPGPQLDSDYVVKSGDTIVWAYAPGDTVPNPDEVVVDPSAPRPTDWKSDWDGKSNAAVENVSTPTGALASSWTFDWKAYSGSAYPNASEPIVVNGNVYLAVNKRLLKIDAESGKVLTESNLKTAVGYTSRPIYANGLVIVPLDGGAVQALTADALTTVWVTDSVSRTAQSNSQLTVDGNYLYVGTVDVDYGTSTYNNGHLTRINILTGAVSWQHVNADEGYYWTGATVGDDYVLVPTSAGTVEMLSKSSGDVLGSVSVGAVVNSSCVLSADGGHAYLISRDGKLHVLAISDGDSRDADAASRITEERVVDLGLTGCACAPTMLDGKLIIGGEVNGGSALAIVDLNNNFATTLVTTADGSQLPAGLGGIKGAPLVSTQADGTYVYFTVNYGESSDYVNYTSGGGVYRYKLGDAEASGVFSATGHNNYCDSPIACDAQGNLYYINDSGTLFKLNAGVKVSFSAGEDSKVDFQTTAANGSITKPADPTREGYTFAGWYTDEACTEEYKFDAAVTADMTLYAKWIKNAVTPGGNGGSGSNGGNGGSGNAGAGSGSGNGTSGQQSGGAVAPGQKPVSATTATKDGKDSKKDSGKDGKKDGKKSDKKSSKSGSKSDTGSAAATTAKKSAEAPVQQSGFNPLAIVGVAAGVIGLAVIGVFVFTKRR